MENKVKEIEEYPPFCCNSVRPIAFRKEIFNKFMEKRGSMDRFIFEVQRHESNENDNYIYGTGLKTNIISKKYFDLHEGNLTEIPAHEVRSSTVDWYSSFTIVDNYNCETHNRYFSLNAIQKRMTGPWKVPIEYPFPRYVCKGFI